MELSRPTHHTLEYPKIKGDKTYVEAPLVEETPGQLPSLPSPKSDPAICYYYNKYKSLLNVECYLHMDISMRFQIALSN